MSLLDTLKKAQEAQQSTTTSSPSQMRNLLAAKMGQTGKRTGPRMSNIGQQFAESQVAAGEEQLATQAQVADEATRAEQQAKTAQFGEQRKGIDISRRMESQDTLLKQQQILTSLQRVEAADMTERQLIDLNFLGQTLRLQDKTYIQDLQQKGNLLRLGDTNTFREEVTETINRDIEELWRSDSDARIALHSSKEDFMAYMQELSFEESLDLANLKLEAEAESQRMQGLSDLATTGIETYGRYEGGQDKQKVAQGMKDAGKEDWEILRDTGIDMNEGDT